VLKMLHLLGDTEAWMWDANAKNLENFFLCSIVTTTDMRLNDASIIEQMHCAFRRVRGSRQHGSRQGGPRRKTGWGLDPACERSSPCCTPPSASPSSPPTTGPSP